MYFLSASGTWINGWPYHRKVLEYIHSCEIFPNMKMITEATGIPAEKAKHTLGHLFAQERRAVSRPMFIAEVEGVPYTEITVDEMLIYRYLEREEENGDYSSPAIIRSFMDRHRYFDDDGNIQYRFSEEQVIQAVKAYTNECNKESKKTPKE